MLTLSSPAKINLFLNILGQREDGFHDLNTIMQTIALHDTLTIQETREGFQFTCSDPELEKDPEKNLVVKAVRLFQQHVPDTPQNLSIHLEKVIPLQAGLGGGSSNAATTLKGLNTLTGNTLSVDELETLGKQLGSDVPFFIQGGMALGTGRGDEITLINSRLPSLPVTIIKPKHLHISTVEAYNWIRQDNTYKLISLSAVTEAISQASSLKELLPHLHNDFHSCVFKHCHELKQTVSTLKNSGIQDVFLSGSGSAMFTFAETPNLEQILKETELDFAIYKTSLL